MKKSSSSSSSLSVLESNEENFRRKFAQFNKQRSHNRRRSSLNARQFSWIQQRKSLCEEFESYTRKSDDSSVYDEYVLKLKRRVNELRCSNDINAVRDMLSELNDAVMGHDSDVAILEDELLQFRSHGHRRVRKFSASQQHDSLRSLDSKYSQRVREIEKELDMYDTVDESVYAAYKQYRRDSTTPCVREAVSSLGVTFTVYTQTELRSLVKKCEVRRLQHQRLKSVLAEWKTKRSVVEKSLCEELDAQLQAQMEYHQNLKRQTQQNLKRSHLSSKLSEMKQKRAVDLREQQHLKRVRHMQAVKQDLVKKRQAFAAQQSRKKLVEGYKAALAKHEKEQEQWRRQHEERQQRQRQREMRYHTERVHERRAIDAQKAKAQEHAATLAEAERQRKLDNLDKLRRTVADRVNSVTTKDFSRLTQPTKAFAAANIQTGKIPLFRVHGYDNDTLMGDPRHRLHIELAARGLTTSDYARQALKKAPTRTAPRHDQKSSVFS